MVYTTYESALVALRRGFLIKEDSNGGYWVVTPESLKVGRLKIEIMEKLMEEGHTNKINANTWEAY